MFMKRAVPPTRVFQLRSFSQIQSRTFVHKPTTGLVQLRSSDLHSAKSTNLPSIHTKPFSTQELRSSKPQRNLIPLQIITKEQYCQARIVENQHEQESEHESDQPHVGKSVKFWLIGCTALVYGIILVGGITRLTESGLSMVEWKFQGSLPPRNEEEWQASFDKYKQFPEFKRLFPNMTLQEYKNIYFWEYLHRMWGRTIGLAIALPMAYFALTKKIRGTLLRRSGLLLGGVAAQGILGWWMVKSGLEEPENATAQPRVSQYRLSAHLGAALLLYSGLLWTTLDVCFPNKIQAPKNVSNSLIRLLKRFSLGTTALVFVTAMSGALLAGLDGGLAYNMWPLMEEGLYKAENAWNLNLLPYFDNKWKWVKDNLFENTAGVQFNHRNLALATATLITSFYIFTRKVASQLPKHVRGARHALMATVAVQVGLGISTLLYLVPIELASSHQAGSVALLSSALWLLHSVMRIRLRR